MSQYPPPPYGAPPPPPYGAPPPPPPRRPRPSGWWFVLGGGLILAGVAIGVGLFVWTLRGFLHTDATVPADGRQHAVSVGTNGDRVLWVHPFDPARCVIADAATGEEVAYSPMTGTFTRSHGSGEWVAESRFDPGSGDLRVICARSGGPVEIGPAPRIGSFVAGLLGTILFPLVLGAIGLVVLIVTAVKFASGAPRGQRPTA
jgi:hypothetical protein